MSEDSTVPQRKVEPGKTQYDAHRRTLRTHRRVTLRGTELFDADGVKEDPSDQLTRRQRDADDDQRILGELPPHWALFSEHRQ